MKEDKESPLKYVKLVSSNEGNGKRESGGEGNFLLKEKEKEVTLQKMGQLHSELFRIWELLGPFVIIELLCLQAWN